ncbi:hypothetical protein, partial [Ensifer aridi]|uniref:hypothetical protein n=1 Tax=Ensifer aridi TaxID=1708715 RepID=UPI001AECF5F2
PAFAKCAIGPTDSTWPYLAVLALFVVPWFLYSAERRKNAEEFIPRDPLAPTSSNELIKREWELDYIVNLKQDEN